LDSQERGGGEARIVGEVPPPFGCSLVPCDEAWMIPETTTQEPQTPAQADPASETRRAPAPLEPAFASSALPAPRLTSPPGRPAGRRWSICWRGDHTPIRQRPTEGLAFSCCLWLWGWGPECFSWPCGIHLPPALDCRSVDQSRCLPHCPMRTANPGLATRCGLFAAMFVGALAAAVRNPAWSGAA
jgi:hypothetical protein